MRDSDLFLRRVAFFTEIPILIRVVSISSPFTIVSVPHWPVGNAEPILVYLFRAIESARTIAIIDPHPPLLTISIELTIQVDAENTAHCVLVSECVLNVSCKWPVRNMI